MLDILVNNAGISLNGKLPDEEGVDGFRRVYETNVFSQVTTFARLKVELTVPVVRLVFIAFPHRAVIATLMCHRAAPANCRLGSCRLGRIVVLLVVVAAGSVGCTTTGRHSQASVYFHTLPPGAQLPTGAYCASLVNSSPQREDKSANKPYNSRKGRHVGGKFLAADGPRAQKLAMRINGDFTGTTIDILRWAACKWGIDQDIVFAQAAVESWWHQDTLGGWITGASRCPPGHKLGRDGKPGECPLTYGILQNTYAPGGWPAVARSTAMNADAAYAVWRSCYDGYETWLNSMPRGSQYHRGDVWGCVGRWFAGQWRNPPALGYIAQVKQYLRKKIWLKPNFRW